MIKKNDRATAMFDEWCTRILVLMRDTLAVLFFLVLAVGVHLLVDELADRA